MQKSTAVIDPAAQIRRFILCIPRGGLNNVFCQILKCLAYAKKEDRLLVIDTTSNHLKEPIEKYIQFHDKNIWTGDLKNWYTEAETYSVYPPEIKTCIRNIPAKWKKTPRGTVYEVDGVNCSPDLKKSYDEDIVIYINCGGGAGINALRISTLSAAIKQEFSVRYNAMPKPYTALHIRNTDRKSNVEEFLQKYSSILGKQPVFLASDDAKLIATLKKKYDMIYTFSEIPECVSVNIHSCHPSQSNDIFNTNVILDLLMLAAAENYNYSCEASGYSKLAKDLHNDKSTLWRLVSA